MNSSEKKRTFDSLQLSSMLNQGSAALFPTDTLPALASSPDKASQLWNIKRRSTKKPLILMGSSSNALLKYASPESVEDAELLTSLYWPGALTIVLPASGEIVDALNPGGETIGLRVPACEVAIELLSLSGPLATTSANLSGSSPATNAKEAANSFPRLPLLAPLPWPIGSGLASTVTLWKSPGNWQILRKGAVILPET